MAKRERVVSHLADKQQHRVRGAITRAFQLPDRGEAHTALMRIRAELELLNRSAAQWLLQDLEQPLTLHQTDMYELLSSSLKGTRCLVHTASQLFRQMRDLRHWLPPEQRHAQYALMLLDRESRMQCISCLCERNCLAKATLPCHDDSLEYPTWGQVLHAACSCQVSTCITNFDVAKI